MTMAVRPPCDAAAIRVGPSAPPSLPGTRRWVLAATILGSSMVFIDSSAVNVALPALQSGLGASVAQVQWVIEAYMLFLAALILLGGALGDRLGRRRVFMWGVALFALASLGCGLAADPRQLIIARAVQGIGGALLVPGSLAIISTSFDEASRGRAIGTWSGMTAITMAAGPVLGGWLVTAFSWRWVFLLNLPFAVAILIIAASRVPETRAPASAARLDWVGAALSVTGLGLLVYGLIESANMGLTHPIVLGAVVAGLLVLVVFVVVEARVPAPMMPLRLFRSRRYAGATLLTVLLYGALGGALFFLPFNLIQVQDYTPAAGRRGLAAFHFHDRDPVAMGGRAGATPRSQGAAGCGPADHGRGLCACHVAGYRRPVLGHVFSSLPGDGTWNVDLGDAAGDGRDEFSAARRSRRRVWHQQCGVAGVGSAGPRRNGGHSARRVQPRARQPPGGGEPEFPRR